MTRRRMVIVLAVALLWAGCKKTESESRSGLEPVSLQLDWYAEPAHGGFYHALLHGYYEEEGLDVSILQGGPGTVHMQAVTVGKADFALGRVDDVIMGIDRGLPLHLAMAYMQKDPQAIMFHASNPIESWGDLAGKAIMVDPAGAFVVWLKKFHKIEFDILPLDYGIQRFLADPEFVQQCFITSQPYFAEQQGIEVKTLLLSDSGYSPERVVMTNRSLIKRKPELVSAFVRASVKGWTEYMNGDPELVHEKLIQLNAANNPGLNAYSHRAMNENAIVFGDGGHSLAFLGANKLQQTIATLVELELVEKPLTLERVIDYDVLPPEVGGP